MHYGTVHRLVEHDSRVVPVLMYKVRLRPSPGSCSRHSLMVGVAEKLWRVKLQEKRHASTTLDNGIGRDAQVTAPS
jgi:hypothetical protein